MTKKKSLTVRIAAISNHYCPVVVTCDSEHNCFGKWSSEKLNCLQNDGIKTISIQQNRLTEKRGRQPGCSWTNISYQRYFEKIFNIWDWDNDTDNVCCLRSPSLILFHKVEALSSYNLLLNSPPEDEFPPILQRAPLPPLIFTDATVPNGPLPLDRSNTNHVRSQEFEMHHFSNHCACLLN